MSAHLKMGMKLTQQLRMTPQLQQSIKMLTLPLMELEQTVREELLENPILEEVQDTVEDQTTDELSNKEGLPPEQHTWMEFTSTSTRGVPAAQGGASSAGIFNLDNVVSTEKSLYAHLIWQIQMSGFTNKEKAHLAVLIDYLNEDGYLRVPLEKISSDMSISLTDLQKSLKLLNTLEPNGVGARDIKECLLIQAEQIQEDTKDLILMIKNHLPDLENKNFNLIAEQMNLEEEEVIDLYKIINSMEPKPGRRFVTQPVHYITPDVYITKEGEDFRVSINDEGLPHLRVTQHYQNILTNADHDKLIQQDSTHRYLRHKMNSAVWLIRSINHRQRTMFKVTTAIVEYQKEFFRKGLIGIKPLILKQIAEKIGVHESTVSRVTTNKYVHTPHGIFELKYFFNSGIETNTGTKISGELVKLKILSYVKEEDTNSPISDQLIMERLQKDLGVYLARRTIAKYREAVHVLSASRRKEA